MQHEDKDPVVDLLIHLANSLHERYPDANIKFTESEHKIVEDWIAKIGELITDAIVQ